MNTSQKYLEYQLALEQERAKSVDIGMLERRSAASAEAIRQGQEASKALRGVEPYIGQYLSVSGVSSPRSAQARYQQLRVDLSTSIEEHLRARRELEEKIAAVKSKAPAIESAIVERQEQIKRLKKVRGNRIPAPNPNADLEFIKAELVAAGKRTTEQQERWEQRWKQAQTDIQQWFTDNEIEQYGIRQLEYAWDNKRYECSMLYRVIEGLSPNKVSTLVVDAASTNLQVPFSERSILRAFKQPRRVVVGLTPWIMSIEKDGALARQIIIRDPDCEFQL